jgi:drug/metabolite transporter (DMT)-like permease
MADLPAPAGIPAPAAGGDRPLAGIGWMLVTGACFVAVTAMVKHGAAGLPAVQGAFIRFLVGLVFVAPGLWALRHLRPGRADWASFGARGAVHSAAVALWFYAMTRIPIAEVTAMNYLSPVYVTLGAALFLGEPLAVRRVLAVAAALVGAAVILRPGFRALDPGHVAMLGTALCFSASYLLAKRQTARFGAATVVAAMSVAVTLILAPLAWAVWVPPSPAQWGWLTAVAAAATAGHYCMTRAFAAAPVTVTQPVTFLQLVWAVLLGWTLFAEAPDPWVIGGGAIILGSVMALTLLEGRARRRPPRVAPLRES